MGGVDFADRPRAGPTEHFRAKGGIGACTIASQDRVWKYLHSPPLASTPPLANSNC